MVKSHFVNEAELKLLLVSRWQRLELSFLARQAGCRSSRPVTSSLELIDNHFLDRLLIEEVVLARIRHLKQVLLLRVAQWVQITFVVVVGDASEIEDLLASRRLWSSFLALGLPKSSQRSTRAFGPLSA